MKKRLEEIDRTLKRHFSEIQSESEITGVVLAVRVENDRPMNMTRLETVKPHLEDLKEIIDEKIKNSNNEKKMYF